MYFKKRYRNYYQSLKGIDFSLERILNTLVDLEILNNTLIIFMNDNGYFHGEHQLINKRYAYKEAIRIPLIIRYQKIFSPNSISNKIILNIDILPTILKACFIKIHNFSFDGYSIQELDEQEIARNFFLYQFFENKSAEIKQYPEIKAIRSMNYKLITYPNSFCFDKFYDLNLDPSDTKDSIYDIKYNNILQDQYQYLFM